MLVMVRVRLLTLNLNALELLLAYTVSQEEGRLIRQGLDTMLSIGNYNCKDCKAPMAESNKGFGHRCHACWIELPEWMQ